MIELIKKFLTREETATGFLRGVAIGALTFGAGTLAAYQESSDWASALVIGAAAGIVPVLGMLGYSGRDIARNDAEADGP